MLNKKNILVVGAAGLLGAQTVNALLEQNASVVAVDIDYEQMLRRLESISANITSSRLELKQLDITKEQQVKDLLLEISEINGAVNCAYPRNKNYGRHFFDVTLADFNENLALHLGSSFLLMQQCAAFFLRNKKTFSFVNIASIYGVIPPKFEVYEDSSMTMPIEYAAIKAGIIHMNKYIANYIRNSDFRINSVSPGGIFDNQTESFLKKYKEFTLGRGMLNVSDVTGAILFLLSDFSKYINGQNLIVDDGFSL